MAQPLSQTLCLPRRTPSKVENGSDHVSVTRIGSMVVGHFSDEIIPRNQNFCMGYDPRTAVRHQIYG